MIARGDAFEETIERLCIEVENRIPGTRSSVMTVGRNNLIQTVVAPSLSEEVCSRYKGVLIGPRVGSCGSAAYLRVAVSAEDIERDPRFDNFRDAFSQIGVRACWSFPVCDCDGSAVAVLAFYYGETRGPTAREKRLMEVFRRLFLIAFDRHARVVDRERRVTVDSLTGLSNRTAFEEALTKVPVGPSGHWALLMIDLDNLKIVNDTFGHQSGDCLIQTVAHRIGEAVAPDVCFRLGGDEFAVLVQHDESRHDLDATASRILAAIAVPADCAGNVIVPQATIGGAISTKCDADPDAVRQNADFALYHAKETCRGSFVRHRPGFDTRIRHRRTAIRDLADALNQGRVDAHYQPIVRLDTREIVGLEALCRLTTPQGDIVAAGAFQDAMSDARVAAALTRQMLATVSADLRIWLDEGLPVQKVGVNVTTADLHAGKLLETIRETFGANDVPLDRLTLEVNESVYMGHRDHAVTREIEKLREHGLSVSLDDFGTGFASLTHLRSIPANNIKIDRSFVADIAAGSVSAAIVEALIGLAERLGMRIVAEGIESNEQASRLSCFLQLLIARRRESYFGVMAKGLREQFLYPGMRTAGSQRQPLSRLASQRLTAQARHPSPRVLESRRLGGIASAPRSPALFPSRPRICPAQSHPNTPRCELFSDLLRRIERAEISGEPPSTWQGPRWGHRTRRGSRNGQELMYSHPTAIS